MSPLLFALFLATFAIGTTEFAVVGLVSWSSKPNLSDGCGGLTGVTPLARYRAWIVEQATKRAVTSSDSAYTNGPAFRAGPTW